MTTSNSVYIHPLADVLSPHIGAGSNLWQFVVVLPNAVIGEGCNICSHCFIENDVVVGDRVTMKSGVQLWDGLRVGDDVFIGPNVTFTNDKYPRSRNPGFRHQLTVIERGASLGAGAVILPGITIGKHAMIAAGAVVTKDVPEGKLVKGNPAVVSGNASYAAH